MKTRTKVITGIAIGAVVVAGGAGIAAGLSSGEETTVLTEEVAVRDVDVTVAASGTVSLLLNSAFSSPALLQRLSHH